MGAEEAALRKIEDIRVADGLAGVVPMVHVEEVEVFGTIPCLDTVQYNCRCDTLSGGINLVHTRIVLRCHGALGSFETAEELVRDLQDVIKGTPCLNSMYHPMTHAVCRTRGDEQQGGRRPSRRCSMEHSYSAWAPKGWRGILIDFSCAALKTSDIVSPRRETTRARSPEV
jgi:hypothetical protein